MGHMSQENQRSTTAESVTAEFITGESVGPVGLSGFGDTFASRKIAVSDEAVLHYVTGGQGTPLVLLHGFRFPAVPGVRLRSRSALPAGVLP